MALGAEVISVIIPCYNAEPYIGDALQSVQSQSVPEYEVIVVDDGSLDGSAELVEQQYPWVRLVRTKNQGPSLARNIGTELAHGEFIQYLDADDLLAPGKLRTQVEALEMTQADVAYGDWQRLVSQPDGRFTAGGMTKRELQGRCEIAFSTDFWCPPAAYLFRRNIVERVGGWNETLLFIQDARFVLDCALYGARFQYCSGVMAFYRVHSSGSVSTRDPKGFVRDCFKNAVQIEQWWMQHGGLDEQRRAALLKTYGYVARQTFANDCATFDVAYGALERLMPGYVPDHPRPLTLVSRLLGYKRAEAVAASYRKAKRIVRA